MICSRKNSKENNNTPSKVNDILPQILAVSVKNILLLGYGMTIGFPTILIGSLSDSNSDETISIGPEETSWIGSINWICVPVGASASGMFTQMLGRRRSMQLVNIPFLAAWLLFYFSSEVWHILVALSLTGLAGGLLEAPVLTYVAEITEPRLRGMLSSTSTMSITFGILCSFVLGLFLTWRNVVLVNCAVPVIAFICLIFVPESPHWLISKNRIEEAKESLAWLRGWKPTTDKKVVEEFDYIKEQIEKGVKMNTRQQNIEPNRKVCVCSLLDIEKVRVFASKTFLWPFVLVTLAFLLGHFGGNTALQTYAIIVFSSFNVPIKANIATVLFGLVQLLGIVTCVVFVHVIGKRMITFISLIGSGICFIILGTYAYIKEVNYLDDSNLGEDGNSSWIPVTIIVISAYLAYVGIKGLPWILIGEVFDNDTRAMGSGLAAAIGYILGFVANKIFYSMVSSFTIPGVLWFYAAIGLLGFVFLYFFLPETEGKTLFEITEHFAGRQKLNNRVGRNKNNMTGTINESYVEDENKDTKF